MYLDALRHLDLEHLLHGNDVSELAAHRRDIVHAVGIRNDLLVIGHVLAVLLEAPVEIADMGDHIHHDLTVHHEFQPEHAVCGRMLRAHADDHLFGAELTPESGDGCGTTSRLNVGQSHVH